MPIVALLSDFGTRDGFAAAVKGVILAIDPNIQVVDATHDIPRGDIETGAWVLSQYCGLFPVGTVHVAVVDPGVGSERGAIALEADGRFVVAPDNGLVTQILLIANTWRCVEITERRYMRPVISQTFQGRDIFAPAAAHLARGVPLEKLGPRVLKPQQIPVVPPERQRDGVSGRVMHVDRFGNLITDIPAAWVDDEWRFWVEGRDVGPLRSSYSDVEVGQLMALPGSLGTVEIAARERSAAEVLEASRGASVVARRS